MNRQKSITISCSVCSLEIYPIMAYNYTLWQIRGYYRGTVLIRSAPNQEQAIEVATRLIIHAIARKSRLPKT